MTVITDRGNFGSFHDVLKDMKVEGYDSITVLRTTHICDQIHLGGLGKLSISDIEDIIRQGVE